MNELLKGALIGGGVVLAGVIAGEIAGDYSLGDWLKDKVLNFFHGAEAAANAAKQRAQARLARAEARANAVLRKIKL